MAIRRLPAVSDFYRGSALFEECDRHHAGASVRADHAANERGVERVRLVLPDVAAEPLKNQKQKEAGVSRQLPAVFS